jgi:dUTPase
MKTTKIKKIACSKNQTYDITVSNNHNFFCNDHLIHNCGYNGEVKVIIFNTTNERIKIEKGQKIAQAVLCPVVNGKWVNLVKVEDIGEKDRNNQGFGSTGLK